MTAPSNPREALEPVLSFLDELAANAVAGKRQALNPILIGGSAQLYAEGMRAALATLSRPKPEAREAIAELTRIANRIAVGIVNSGLVQDESAIRADERKKLRNRLDSHLNDVLCEMKEGWDDSVCGFNEAWDVMRKVFDVAIRSRSDGGEQG